MAELTNNDTVSGANNRKLIYGCALLTAVLTLSVLLPLQDSQNWLLALTGRFHPLFVHLPIGIFLALFLLEILNLVRPSLQLTPACRILLWLVAISAVPTVLAGVLLAADGGYGDTVLFRHRWLGWAMATVSIWLLVLRRLADTGKGKSFANLYYAALMINVVLLAGAGHYGGSLTHGSGYLTKKLPDDIKIALGLADAKPKAFLALDSSGKEYVFEDDIKPVLEQYCAGCHGPEKQKGGLRLDTLDPDLARGPDASKWRVVLDMINSGEMPPEGKSHPGDEERRALVEWMTASLRYAAEMKRGENKAVIRRLTKDQYTHSLNTLLGVSVRFGDVLPDDAKSEMGFSNNGEVLQISPLHVEYYQRIARQALDKAIAPAERPQATRYRVTLGKGIGIDKPAGRIGGYQSAPINPDDFIVDILDANGLPIEAANDSAAAALAEIKQNIGVGMRGSHPDRYQVVKEGLMLYSALPHKEVTPKSWQGPSPNLKLLFRRYFPTEGDFVFRVHASRGYQWGFRQEGFISLRRPEPAAQLPDAIRLKAAECNLTDNLIIKGDMLIPEDVTADCYARFRFNAPRDGYYQVDMIHPYVSDDGMPSLQLQIDRFKLQERLHLSTENADKKAIVRPLTLAWLKKGQHRLGVGGRFFVGFSSVIVTPLPEDHELVTQLDAEAETGRLKYQRDLPVIRTFAGTRTDDGMDYKTFDSFRNVAAKLGESQEYTFRGRLENMPIPEIDLIDTEILSNIMIVGLWNDYLVKENQHSGPPLLIEALEFEAPYYPVWPPETHTRIFFDSPEQDNPEIYTAGVLKRFIERAYRRPLQDGELERYMQFWHSIKDDYTRYEDGVKEVLVAVLCSPNFLYLTEPEDNEEYSLATKLAYFLWNSPPDNSLIQKAAEGRLQEELQPQMQSMLRDPRAWRMVRMFANEWLRLDRHESMSTNVEEYEAFTRFIKHDMAEETYHFVYHVLKQNMSIFALIDSDFTMLNQNLAEFYGIEGVTGSHFRPVALAPGSNRGGLLSQGAFLSGHSDGSQAHAIKRAVWLKAKILGDEPPPPPPNVPELDPETPGFDKLTLKEQLELHRDKASCNDCHRKLDPYGVVFENYNAVGMFQTEAKGKPIDASVQLPDGTQIDGVDGIKDYILKTKRDEFTRSLVKHLFAYALGRDISFMDEEEIDRIVEKVRADDYRFQSVIEHIVTSDSFTGNS